jgi:hypothetical protein
MWGLILSAVIQTAAAECRFEPGPADGPIQVIAPARGAVILEIRLQGQAPPPTAMLEVLSERGVPATVLPSTRWAARHGASLAGLSEAGHELGYWLSVREDLQLRGQITTPPSLSHWVRSLREAKDGIEAATGQTVRTIGLRRLPEIGEKAMEGLGFRTILPSERTVGDQPRRSASLHSPAGRARIFGEGPYEDGCGAVLPAWTPAALDRATRVAARSQWLRIGLPSDPAAAPLLARWLDQVVLPQRWTVLTASEAGERAKPGLGAPDTEATQPAPTTTREVPVASWTEAAQALADVRRLPRQLPGRLTPTEAFLGLAQLMAIERPTGPIALGPLRPPAELARSSLGAAPVDLTEQAVRDAAVDLLPALTGQVPGFISVGTQSLTAAEFLRVMARVYLGLAPSARRVADPNPYAPGGGWGESEGL